jgi:hypothetical protein
MITFVWCWLSFNVGLLVGIVYETCMQERDRGRE